MLVAMEQNTTLYLFTKRNFVGIFCEMWTLMLFHLTLIYVHLCFVRENNGKGSQILVFLEKSNKFQYIN